jgi:hypothetical protein
LPKLKPYPIFISHAWNHSFEYDRLVNLLSKAKRFDLRNCSIPKTKRLHTKTDAQLERALRNQIARSNSVLVIAGMWVKNREWIKKEIKIAFEKHKNIVVIKPHGAQKMPKELQGLPQQVGWDTQHIIRAIRHPVKMDPNILNDLELRSETNDSPAASWQQNIAKNPDFAALQEWINDPESPDAEPFKNRSKALERRRGVSG